MTFYEQELRKLFADGTVIGSPKFTGRACLGTLGKDLRARVQFVTSGHADHYDVISVTVLNRTDGVVDKLRLRLKDILGVKQVPGNPNFRNGVAPHIWEDSGKAEWYAFRPSAADYSAMRQAVSEYLGVFRDRVTERRQDGKPGTGSGGTGDGPAVGGVLPAGQRLRPRLDGGHVGGDQPRREAGDPCPDRPKGAGKAPAPAN